MDASLYGRSLDEAEPHLGSLAQAVRCESYVLSGGPSAGARRIRLTVGPIDVELLPDRGLDIGAVRFAGEAVAWLGPTGLPTRRSVDDFAQTFGGGLLTTCGLLNYGPAVTVDGEAHPMHGRYSTLPAEVHRAEAARSGAVVEATVTEAEIFGARLELRRRIEVPLDGGRIRITDIVTNRGVRSVAPMVLYHLNFGWPLIDTGTRLETGAAAVVPRDAAAAAGAESWDLFPELTESYPEQVFVHELPGAGSGAGTGALSQPGVVRILNPSGLTATVRFDTATLPGLIQWRVAERGLAVLGIEPASAPTILGRGDAAERGMLQPLAPGEDRRYAVEISFDRE